MTVTESLRQFAHGLGKDYMPGDILFAPHYEDDIVDTQRETVRVTTMPHQGEEIEVPKRRVTATKFVAEEQPPIRQLMPASRPAMRSHGALAR